MTVRSHQTWDKLAAGYALHALSPEDEHAFLAHLPSCAMCADTIETDAAVTEALAELAPPVEPPARLRARVLAITDDVPEPIAAPATLPARRLSPMWLSAAAAVLLVAVGINLASRPTGTPGTPAAAVRLCQAEEECRSFSLLAVGDNRQLGAVVVRGSSGQVFVDGLAVNDPTATTYVLWQKAGRGPVLALAAFDVEPGTTVVRRDLRAPLTRTDWLAVSIEKGRVAPPTPSVPVALALVASR